MFRDLSLFGWANTDHRMFRLLQDLFLSVWNVRTRPRKSKTCKLGMIGRAFFVINTLLDFWDIFTLSFLSFSWVMIPTSSSSMLWLIPVKSLCEFFKSCFRGFLRLTRGCFDVFYVVLLSKSFANWNSKPFYEDIHPIFQHSLAVFTSLLLTRSVLLATRMHGIPCGSNTSAILR